MPKLSPFQRTLGSQNVCLLLQVFCHYALSKNITNILFYYSLYSGWLLNGLSKSAHVGVIVVLIWVFPVSFFPIRYMFAWISYLVQKQFIETGSERIAEIWIRQVRHVNTTCSTVLRLSQCIETMVFLYYFFFFLNRVKPHSFCFTLHLSLLPTFISRFISSKQVITVLWGILSATSENRLMKAAMRSTGTYKTPPIVSCRL